MIVEESKTEKKKNLKPYVEVKDLVTQFFTSRGIVKALDKVSFAVYPGEIYGLVGESGCGKSVTSTSVMDLIPDPPGRIISGEIYIDGFNVIADLNKMARIKIKSETDVRIKRYKRAIKRHNNVLSKIRGDKIAMIFQEPFLALNPTMTIGAQIMEVIMLHNISSISNSILRRENISPGEVRNFINEFYSLGDETLKRKEAHNFSSSYAIPEFEESILSLLSTSDDKQYIENEILNMIRENKSGINIQNIKEIKGYFDLQNDIFQYTLKLLQAERNGDSSAIKQLNTELSKLKRIEASSFFLLKLKLKFAYKYFMNEYRKEARRRTLELLALVNIAGPEVVIDSFPHELSGGMQQRAMIAMSLASNPRMLIADEPTTALDVTTQAQILEIIKDLNKLIGMGVLFITHDLAVIAETCNRVGVMYAGNIVEESSTVEIFNDPKHPYTVGLMSSVPRADKKREKEIKLETIPGIVPNLITPPSGCRFHPRCKFAMDICSLKKPKLVEISEKHKVACFLYSDESEVE